jgi:hypothetical protein
LLIGETAGPRIEFDATTEELAVTDATLSLTRNGIVTTISNDADTSTTGFTGITIYDEIDPDGIEILKDAIYFVKGGSITSRLDTTTSEHQLILSGTGGGAVYGNNALSLLSNQVVLAAGPAELTFNGVTVIDGSRNGAFNAVSFVDAATTRTNLDVYSKAEVDALIGGGGAFVTLAEYSGHTHTFADSGTTTLADAHTHDFAVSGNTGTP